MLSILRHVSLEVAGGTRAMFNRRQQRPDQRVMRAGIGFAIAAAISWSHAPAQAVQLANGTVYFIQVPQLVKARTSYNDVRVWGATYYFTVAVPADAGEALQQVVIRQQEGFDRIVFKLPQTYAYTNDDRDQVVPIQRVTADTQNGIAVVFDPVIAPGQTVTVALRPVQNPWASGVYLFGVTAFPEGKKAHGQFLGYGRLQFYDGFTSGLLPWWR